MTPGPLAPAPPGHHDAHNDQMPYLPDDDPDDLLTRIDHLLADDPDPDPDPFSWTDAATWHAPEVTHCPVTGRVYLDAAGWTV